MSDIVLEKSKILCYFTIDPSLQQSKDDLMQPALLPLTVFHFHYPPAYYPTLYKHFKEHFPSKTTQNHICIKKNGQQLPPELPLGLQLENNDNLIVSFRETAVPQGFRLIEASWKKGYTIVNRQGGCDHVFKKLKQDERKDLYKLHLMGRSHGLHKIPKYEGNCIALKIYCSGAVIQRKEDHLELTTGDYLKRNFEGVFNLQGGVFTHGVKIDLNMKLKQLLQVWNYNDGYCYLKVTQ